MVRGIGGGIGFEKKRRYVLTETKNWREMRKKVGKTVGGEEGERDREREREGERERD